MKSTKPNCVLGVFLLWKKNGTRKKICIEMLEKELVLHEQEISDIGTKLESEKSKRAAMIKTLGSFLEANERRFYFSWKSSIDTSGSTLNAPAVAMSVCKVEKDFASAAQVILTNQGDIVANCLFEGTLRWHLLEIACAIYQKMENLRLKDITLVELEAVQKDVFDLEKAQVDVSWLSKGLDDIYKTRKSLGCASLIKKQCRQNLKVILALDRRSKSSEKNVKELCGQLEAEKARIASLEQDISEAKEKVSSFYRKSLVNGI